LFDERITPSPNETNQAVEVDGRDDVDVQYVPLVVQEHAGAEQPGTHAA